MLTARKIVIVLLVVAGVSLVTGVAGLFGSPDRNGIGKDSYGNRAFGHKAVYRSLERIGIGTERGLATPAHYLGDDVVMFFCGPEPAIVEAEPEYLARTVEWVRRGGRAVVALNGPFSDATSLFELLTLEHVSVREVSETGPNDTPSEEDDDNADWTIRLSTLMEKRSLPVTFTGSFGKLGAVAKTVALPKNGYSILTGGEGDGSHPVGEVRVRAADGELYTIAAEYALDGGSLILVGDSTIFSNCFLTEEDNPVLAAHLLFAPGRKVVFDEFYHGLTVRGNPAWLLSRHPNGLTALMLLVLTLTVCWRAAVRLGPPKPEPQPSRRNIGEYIDAMGAMFVRRDCRQFVLRQVYEGVLWAVRKEHNLNPKMERPAALAAVVGRRYPERAARLTAAAEKCTALLAQNTDKINKAAIVAAAREIAACL